MTNPAITPKNTSGMIRSPKKHLRCGTHSLSHVRWCCRPAAPSEPRPPAPTVVSRSSSTARALAPAPNTSRTQRQLALAANRSSMRTRTRSQRRTRHLRAPGSTGAEHYTRREQQAEKGGVDRMPHVGVGPGHKQCIALADLGREAPLRTEDANRGDGRGTRAEGQRRDAREPRVAERMRTKYR